MWRMMVIVVSFFYGGLGDDLPEYNVKDDQKICCISWLKHDWMKDAHFLNQMWFFQQFRNYIDQLEQPGGKQYNIQNFMMMYIFGATTNTEYRTRLFDHWPTVGSSPNNIEMLDHSSVSPLSILRISTSARPSWATGTYHLGWTMDAKTSLSQIVITLLKTFIWYLKGFWYNFDLITKPIM